MKKDLEKIEQQMAICEEELDMPEKKLDILLKSINIFSKPAKLNQTNLGEDGKYKPPEIFEAKTFFPDSN